MATSSEKLPTSNPGAGFDSRGVGLRVQKKLASRFAGSRRAMRTVVDDSTACLLDNIYRLAKLHCGSRREAEKVAKNVVKIVVKVGILARNDQFNKEEVTMALEFKQKFRLLCMTLVSFRRVSFSYDRAFLLQSIAELQELLIRLITRHLTEKSRSRVEFVCQFFQTDDLLDKCFGNGSVGKAGNANPATEEHDEEDKEEELEISRVVDCLVDEIDKLLESGAL